MFPIIKITAISISLIVIVVSVTYCSNKNVNDPQGKNTMTAQTIEDVLKKHTNELMSIPGVVGTAQGLCNGKPCIKVFVIKKTLELDKNIPGILEGYKVVVEETGEIRALPKDQE